MTSRIKYILFIITTGFLLILLASYYMLNMPHRNIEKEKPAFTLSVNEIFDDFNQDEIASNIKYGNKVIMVTGNIVEISKNGSYISIVLNDEMEGINCLLDSAVTSRDLNLINQLNMGDKITIKGKCDGFDMIMGVVLTQCYIVK